MESKKCINCENTFYKNKNVSKETWKGVKFCSRTCIFQYKRTEKECLICKNNFSLMRCHENLLKTCSPECRSKLRSINSIKIYEEKGAPIFRGSALQKMTDTKRRQSKDGELGYLYGIQLKKGDWEKEKNPRWQPIGTTKNDGHGYILVKVADGQGFKNWIQEHVFVMENKIGRKINSKIEVIHHINGIKADNRIENLFLTTQSYHKQLHQSVFMSLVKDLLDLNIISFDQSEGKYILNK